MKITKGKWITATIGSEHRVVTPRGHLTIARCGSGSEDKDNAALIAEAGTVHNETGYSPRQLAEQKKALLDVVGPLLEAYCNMSQMLQTEFQFLGDQLTQQAEAAIASATI